MLKKMVLLTVFIGVIFTSSDACEPDIYYLESIKKVDALGHAIKQCKFAPFSFPHDGRTPERSVAIARKNLQKFAKVLRKFVVETTNTANIVFDKALLKKTLKKGTVNFAKKQGYRKPFLIPFTPLTALSGIVFGLLYYSDHNYNNNFLLKSILIGSLSGAAFGSFFGGIAAFAEYMRNKQYINDLCVVFRELYTEYLMNNPV